MGEGWCLRDGSVVKSEDYSHRGPKSLVCSTQVRQLTATIPVPGIEHLWCPCALVCGMLEHACVHTHTYTHKANIFFFSISQFTTSFYYFFEGSVLLVDLLMAAGLSRLLIPTWIRNARNLPTSPKLSDYSPRLAHVRVLLAFTALLLDQTPSVLLGPLDCFPHGQSF